MIRRPASALFLAAALLVPSAALAQRDLTLSGVRLEILPERPCMGDSLALRVSWCSNCTRLIRAGWEPNGGGLVVEVERTSADSCGPGNCVDAHTSVDLGRHNAGHYQLSGTFNDHVPGQPVRSTGFTMSYDVSRDCGTPPPGPVPFIDSVTIRGARTHGPPCGGDSLLVTVSGHFPSDCFMVRRIELMWPMCVRPCPPIVNILFDDGGCLGRPCVIGPTPFNARLVLPGLPASDHPYGLVLNGWLTSCSDSFPPGEPDGTLVKEFFVGADSACGPPPPPSHCLIPKWANDPGPCNATVGPDRPALVVLKIQSADPLAGLQGKLVLGGPGLRITSLATADATLGWNLSYQLLPNGGASFVMFSENGSTIPAMTPSFQDTLGARVLRVFAEATSAPIPPVTYVIPDLLFGSNPAGGGVSLCPFPANVRWNGAVAAICADRPCDANGDNISDIRDIVRMVNCLHDSACGIGSQFDCEQDGDFDLADVVCCALRILRHGAPHDTGEVRPPADVGASLGMPVVAADGTVSLPVTVRNANALGAAMLRLRFPGGEYTLEGIDNPWGVGRLALHSRDGDEIALALVRVPGEVTPASPGVVEPADATFTLRFRPMAGAGGGALELLDGQFASLDGRRIDADVAAGSMPITPPARAVISAARPNPFTRETRFSVDLPFAATVDVSVHDLSGRRVSVLFHGDLPAGRRDFTWSGAIDRGGRAADGVYFLRLAANGEIVSRKVIMLRSP